MGGIIVSGRKAASESDIIAWKARKARLSLGALPRVAEGVETDAPGKFREAWRWKGWYHCISSTILFTIGSHRIVCIRGSKYGGECT